jgi:hypothetical protein
MKLILVAAAAMIAMPAIAQNAPAPSPAPDPQTAPATPPAPDATTPPAAPLPAPPGPPAGPVTMTMGPSTPVVQPLPDSAAPATGADVPWCTKTVVDHCKEHSAPNGARLHTTPRPPGA